MQISFNRSSATIASPTNWMGEALFGDHMFQSLKRDNCLSNTVPLLRCNILSVFFQSLKRDNCLSNRIVAAFPTATSYGFNRSSATIASPTSVSWYTRICRPCMFQSLKRDNCLSNPRMQWISQCKQTKFQSLKRDNCLSNLLPSHPH